MLRMLKDLERYTVAAMDGDVGSVVSFLVDDERWAVRYLVTETGLFFGGRRVLVSPMSFRQADWATSSFHVHLTMDQVKLAPSIDAEQPVSRGHEMAFCAYYRYPHYWDAAARTQDRRLRSVDEVRGYRVHGSDDAVGHIEDFVVDDGSWEVRYLVVDLGHLWTGKSVLVAPSWASRIAWHERKLFFDKSRAEIRNGPTWRADAPIDRELESRLHAYYGRASYWDAPAPPAINCA